MNRTTASTRVSLDATPPTRPTIGGVTQGATYTLGQAPPAATCASSDALSGLASCTVVTSPSTAA